jgi:hypothetical protein
VTASWSEASNWLDGAAPASGDRLIFFQGPRSTNDLAGTAFSSVVLGTNGHAFDGAPIILTSAQPVELARGGSATFGGGVQFAAGRVVIAAAHTQVNFLGPIMAPQGCTLALGVGGALIAGANACGIESTTSLLEVKSAAGLGPGRVTVTQGTLRLGDAAMPGIFVTNPISMRGLDGIPARIETRAGSGSGDFAAPIDMDGDVEISAGADTDIRDSVGGLGRLTLTVADDAVLTLSGAVSPHGGLEIAHGRVAIAGTDLPRTTTSRSTWGAASSSAAS